MKGDIHPPIGAVNANLEHHLAVRNRTEGDRIGVAYVDNTQKKPVLISICSLGLKTET